MQTELINIFYSPRIRMRTVSCIFLWLILFQFAQTPLLGQHPEVFFQQISIKDNLSQSTVHAILKDSLGFLWFGTDDGLNLYDGDQIKVYKHDPGNPKSISNSAIWSIYEDPSGTLWIGTFNGLNRYNREQDSFTTFHADPNIPGSLSNNYVRSIIEDDNGNLWVGTNMGLNRYNENREFVSYMDHTGFISGRESNVINSMIIDHLGTLWIGTNDGLMVYIEKSDTFIKYKLPNKSQGNSITSLFEDDKGKLWIGTDNNGLFTFNRPTSSFSKIDLNHGRTNTDISVNSISGTTTDITWVGTNRGLYSISENKGEIIVYRPDYFNDHSISDIDILSLYSEENGFVWIGTINAGINIINPSKTRFGHITSRYNGLKYFNNSVVRAIAEDENGNILVGKSNGGVNVYHPETNTFSKLEGQIDRVLSQQPITAILIDNDTYWFGLRDRGLLKYNIKTGAIQNYFYSTESRNSTREVDVISIIKEKSGNIWIGTNGDGLIEFNPETEDYTWYDHDPASQTSISNDRIYAIFEDSEGDIWLATAGGGLNLFNKETKEFINFNHDPNDSTSWEFNYILSIIEDDSGDIWAGTFGNGLIQYVKDENTFNFYNENNGLLNNVIYGILKDDRNNLWLSHNKGITKFNLENNSLQNYDVQDGLQGNEFNSNASFKCRNGKLIFGGSNGFNIFHPDSIKVNEIAPPIVFTGLKISNLDVPIGEMEDGRTVLEKSVIHAREVNLKHSDREIYLQFVSLDYSVPGKNMFKYKLLGRDDDWIDLGTANHVSFHELPLGKSTLHVIGSNNDGIWNEVGASIDLIVKPPFYNTILFYFTVFLLFFGLILLYYYIKTKNLRVQKQELEYLIQSKTKEIAQQRDVLELKNDELESKNLAAIEQAEKTTEIADRLDQANQSKLQFFTNISHEFRTPLTLILGFIEKLLNTTSDYKQSERIEDYMMIEKNANKLLKLINRLMQFRKLTTQSANLKISENDLVDFIRNQASLYRNLAEKKDINFTFESGEESLMTWFDPEQMEEVITNLLSNAFKFSPSNTAIKVSVGRGVDSRLYEATRNKLSNPEQYVYFFVEDLGIGIPENKQKLVFKRFYQVDAENTSSDQTTGAGIGLHICDMIIKMHKGEILLKSSTEEGTVFAVLLKIGKTHLSEHEFVDLPGGKVKNIIPEEENSKEEDVVLSDTIDTTIEQLSKKDLPKILVIEDNHELRRFVTKGLSGDYRLIEAENGSQAVKLLEEHDPEVIICDVLLPGKMNGFDFVERIKSNISTSHIPIIMLTALDSVDQKILGLEKGADIYMTKPFSLRELKAHIQSIIQSRLTLKRKFREQAFLNSRELEISDKDESFIQKTIRVIETSMSDPQFNVSYLCDAMNMSQTKLYRKVKALTDMTITDFIRGLRLRKASSLLLETDKNVSEIAYEVGFNDPNYFGKCFKSQFGCSPSEFVKDKNARK